MGDAWIGTGLCAATEGRTEVARENFQIAAVLEPQRAVLRSHLGQALAAAGSDALADHEFALALALDPNDPTAWLYRALHEQQTHRLNASVRDLEESLARNDRRAVYRSSLLLDEDRALRSADLAIAYDVLGLEEVAARSASRAIDDDYARFEAHLFRARTLQSREDPSRFDLRLEPARQNQLLLANLLAPPGGANLSQQLSEQDHLRALANPRFGGSSLTEYRSSGDWEQLASVYGTLGRFGYALDAQYASIHGERPNAARELSQVSIQAKQAVAEAGSLYVQAGYLRREGGDPAPRYDPETAIPGFRYHEWETPSAYVGYTHTWNPGIHTLALVSHLQIAGKAAGSGGLGPGGEHEHQGKSRNNGNR